ncbi:MAG: hypothetical protein M1837_005273 [Sclerophora amabilis]|nr:MAG: hypothetical protein M1837_005273 [Sclerophora amabilis]
MPLSSTPLRRSTRDQKRKRYSENTFEGLDILSDESRSDQGSPRSEQREGTPDEDSDFEEASVDGEVEEEVESGADVASVVEEDETPRDDGDEVVEPPRKKTANRPSVTGPGRAKSNTNSKSAPIGGLHRGAIDHLQHAGKKEKYLGMFGAGTDDLVGAIRSRDKWANVVTLPTLVSDETDRGGFHYSFFQSEELRQREAVEDWHWYYEGQGRESFLSGQVSNPVSSEEGETFLPQPSVQSHDVLVGPIQQQTMVRLREREPVSISKAWEMAVNDLPSLPKQQKERTKDRREGWILNAGDKIQCMAWAPNRDEEATQYLAITTMRMDSREPGMQGATAGSQGDSEQRTSNAFTPSPPSPSSIQLWAISATSAEGENGRMESRVRPSLQLVLCTEWGDITQIQWCPTPRIRKERPDQEDIVDLGLLACISGDGRIRVLDMQYKMGWHLSTQYVYVQAVAFESLPPSTICSCISWLSSSHIAAGCANGYAAVWDLSGCLSFSSPESSPNPRPHFYHPLHRTYILSITSPYPSHPSHIITSSMDGYVRLTSLSNPHSDSVFSPRSRNGSPTIAWSEAIQSILCPEENNSLRAYPFRRFYSSITVGRHSASVTCVATSPSHPCVLVAGADGKVTVSAPLRKAILAPKGKAYCQTWFGHEWTSRGGGGGGGGGGRNRSASNDEANDGDTTTTTGPQEDSSSSSASPNPTQQSQPRRSGAGISRFTDGYHVTNASLYRNLIGNKNPVLSTLYEERTAITCVDWNPNARCGGWAAAGMASGLLRVEDLSI